MGCVHCLNILPKLFGICNPTFLNTNSKFSDISKSNGFYTLSQILLILFSVIYHIICRVLMSMSTLFNDINIFRAWVLSTKVLPTIFFWRRHSYAEVSKRLWYLH